MMILIFGENSFLSKRKVKVMKTHFLNKFDTSGFNLSEFDEKSDYGDIIQSIMTQPFISKKRLVIVSGILSELKKKEAKIWFDDLKNMPNSTILIFLSFDTTKKVEKSQLFKMLSVYNPHIYAYGEMSDMKVRDWVIDYSSDINLNMSHEMALKLVGMIGDDFWSLINELDKLKAKKGDTEVAGYDLEDIKRSNFQDEIFSLMDSISERNAEKTLNLLMSQRSFGSSDFQLFSMLLRQIKLLYSAKRYSLENGIHSQSDFAKKMKIHPYVAQKILVQSSKFDLSELTILYRKCFEYEKMLKSSGIKAGVAMDNLLINLFIS